MNNNLYDLVLIRIYDVDVYARPIAFSAEVVDYNKCTDSFGRKVYVTRVMLTCPACGSPIEHDLNNECVCLRCESLKPAKVHPFRDPVKCGKIKLHQLIEHVFDPDKGFTFEINEDRRQAVFSDFVDHTTSHRLPKSDLGLDDMVEE